mmetsp:Transcript_35043/g.100077  ORF Transcript_35043/g.100077 Transcript_35043/m.100077 type:complete len:267 (+) Transcript_35043:761-1561(+)
MRPDLAVRPVAQPGVAVGREDVVLLARKDADTAVRPDRLPHDAGLVGLQLDHGQAVERRPAPGAGRADAQLRAAPPILAGAAAQLAAGPVRPRLVTLHRGLRAALGPQAALVPLAAVRGHPVGQLRPGRGLRHARRAAAQCRAVPGAWVFVRQHRPRCAVGPAHGKILGLGEALHAPLLAAAGLQAVVKAAAALVLDPRRDAPPAAGCARRAHAQLCAVPGVIVHVLRVRPLRARGLAAREAWLLHVALPAGLRAAPGLRAVLAGP